MENPGIDLGDLPVPVDAPAISAIRDSFDYNVAFNLAFVGVGQCGGRIAATFTKLGYGRVCAINTTIQDLTELKLPERSKLDIGGAQGAGKDPAIAARLIEDNSEEVYDLYRSTLGTDADYVMICFAAAGGTGAGAFPTAVKIAKRFMQETHRPVKVGAIVALPKDSEGQRYARNAIRTVQQLAASGLSPIVVIDNQKVKEIFTSTPPSKEHALCNESTARLLHSFNRLAGSDSEHTTFDRADFAKLLDSGMIALGAHVLAEWKNEADFAAAVRQQLRRNLLTYTDIGNSTLAALVYVLNGAAYEAVPAAYLDHGAATLTRLLGQNSTVLQGLYRGTADGNSVSTLVMVGGLPWPVSRMQDLARVAGVDYEERILGL